MTIATPAKGIDQEVHEDGQRWRFHSMARQTIRSGDESNQSWSYRYDQPGGHGKSPDPTANGDDPPDGHRKKPACDGNDYV